MEARECSDHSFAPIPLPLRAGGKTHGPTAQAVAKTGFRRNDPGRWQYSRNASSDRFLQNEFLHSFAETSIANPDNRVYLRNAYRVLLTRARQGMVVFVPLGAPNDPTRSPEFYDSTFSYLRGL